MRRIIFEAFGSYFILDPSQGGTLRIRFSESAPTNAYQEFGLHKEALEFYANAQLIDIASDGVKAFTGMIIEIIAGDPRILLIDEPEAFLHPSLAFTLGKEISQAAQAANKRVFSSTHSPSFVMGCVHSGTPLNIIRLTYRNKIPTARLLPSDKILTMMRNPLLRSTGVLSGLFYEFVVVTEGDSDRAFYQEINERLLRFKREWGIPNCLFINAQNKQTLRTIIQPLRSLGIPVAAIADIDIIKDGGMNWTNLLSAANVPPIQQEGLNIQRATVKRVMEATGLDMKRKGGIDILSDTQQKEGAKNLLDTIKEYGIFIVPRGELESWLIKLGVKERHGPEWLVEIFELMGEDPNSNRYVKPTEDDVWLFMSEIKNWLMNPAHKGIPNQ